MLIQVLLTLSLVCQETRSSFLNLRVREWLVSHTLLDHRPGKYGLDGLPESKGGGSAEQSAEEVEELHLGRDRMEAVTRRPALQLLDQQQYLNIFVCDGIAALGPWRLSTRRRRKLRAHK